MNREENKQVDGEFIDNSAISFCPSDLANTLHSINNELAIIDELLFDAGVESILNCTHKSGQLKVEQT